MSERDRTAMTAARWRQVSRLFEAASALDPGERESFLDQQCGDDPELRAEVASLLAADENTPAFLELGGIDLVAPEARSGGQPTADVEGGLVGGDLAGRRLGHYEILELLGRGGMGEVYVAEDRTLGRRVALKVLPPELAADPERRARLQLEARIAASLNHPSLVTIHSVEEAEGIHFLTMELVEGETLTEWIRRGGASLTQLLDLGRQLVEALAAAHDRGIVHRDLKPGNLMITADRRVKVLDFGIGKLRQPGEGASSELSLEWGVKGTVPYMSPEQLAKGIADHRSDLFSLGVVLYEMATGRRPFRGYSVATVASAILRDPPRELSELRPDLPVALRALIHRCLEKDPANRWSSAAELARELRDIAAAVRSGVESGPGSPAARVSSPSRRASIAVLPLVDLSPARDDDYFGDGLAAELINALGRVEGLRVVARTSSFRFRGETVDAREAGRRLDVATVLEGTVRRYGDRVRITVELVDVADGSQLWSQAYDRGLDDLIEIQRETARAIVEQLKLQLESPSGDSPLPESAGPPEAYEAYLEARHLWNRRTEASVRRSIERFQRALELDPTHASAYAGLADAYALLGSLGVLPARHFVSRAREAATRALELDDGLAEAHATLGSIYGGHEWRWAEAEEEFRWALRLNPSYAIARQWLAELLVALGRGEEALAESRRAEELDPLSAVTRTTHGWILYLLRRHEEAREQLRTTLELDPAFALGRLYLGSTLRMIGAMDQALEELREAVRLSGHAPLPVATLGEAAGAAGDDVAAQQTLEELRGMAKERYVSPYCLAIAHLGSGDHELALQALEQAFEERSDYLVFLRVEPVLDPLRADPRFAALMQRVGL